MDDVAALEHASHAVRMLEPFKGLGRNATLREQRQMLDELQEVTQALFSDRSSFPDPKPFANDGKKEDALPKPLDPYDLVFAIWTTPPGQSVAFREFVSTRVVVAYGHPSAAIRCRVQRWNPDVFPGDGDENLDEGQTPIAPRTMR